MVARKKKAAPKASKKNAEEQQTLNDLLMRSMKFEIDEEYENGTTKESKKESSTEEC